MTRLRLRLVAFALLAALTSSAASTPADAGAADARASPLMVHAGERRFSADEHLELLPDPGGEFTIGDVRTAPLAEQFVPSRAATPNLGFDRKVYWARLRLENRLVQPATYFLDLGYPLLDSVRAYILSPAGMTAYQTGDREPFSSRPVSARTFMFPVELEPSQPVTIYLRVETTGSLRLPLHLLSRDAAFSCIAVHQGLLALYYGALLMLVIYNLYHFWRLKDVNAGYYAVFIACYIAFQLALTGIAFQFFWPDHPEWANVSLPFFLCAAYFFGVLFTRSILDTATNAPRIHRVLGALRWLSFVGMALALLGPYDIALRFAVTLVFTVVLFIVAGIKIGLQGYRPARLYSLAWTVLLGCMIVYALSAYGLLPTTFFTTWSTQIGSAWEAVILAFAISDRFYLLEEQRREMQASHALALQQANEKLNGLNDQLEARVQDGLRDLNLSNQQLREQAEVLRRAERRAESANRAKSEFLANVSHELRTPMNAIAGFLHLLSEGKLSDAQRGYTEKAERAARALMHLIKELLDFSTMDVGRLELELASVDISALARDARDLVMLAASEKGLSLKLEQQGTECCWVRADEARLLQVLVNLLHNAIKFTPSGEVCLMIACRPSANGDIQLSVTVSDTGIGIGEEQRERLFLPFTQADGSITRRFGGTGLGLAICQRLVRQMGGEIELESTLGVGSRFSFVLELSAAPPRPQPPASSGLAHHDRPLVGLCVLVVDDQPLNQEVLAALLERAGADVVISASGRDALERLLDGARVDVVLMDLQMPNMDGYETATRINGLALRNTPPIVAITARVAAAPGAHFRAAGFAGHLFKPVDHDQLIETLQRIAAVGGPSGPPGNSVSPESASRTQAAADVPSTPAALLAPGLVASSDMDFDEHLDRLHRFAERFADYPALIRARADAGDLSSAVDAAHAIAGVALTLGITEVGATAKQLEREADASADAHTLAALIGSFETALTTALDSVAKLRAAAGPSSDGQRIAATADCSAPLDPVTLEARLRRLDALLAQHNLRARDEVDALVDEVGDADRRRLVAAVGAQVRGLDFAAARAGLAELLGELRQRVASARPSVLGDAPERESSGND